MAILPGASLPAPFFQRHLLTSCLCHILVIVMILQTFHDFIHYGDLPSVIFDVTMVTEHFLSKKTFLFFVLSCFILLKILVHLQCCAHFCCTAKWLCYMYTSQETRYSCPYYRVGSCCLIKYVCVCVCVCVCVFVFLPFPGLLLWHMEVPRLGSSLVVQLVKDLVLSQPWLGFDPWARNVCMLLAWP